MDSLILKIVIISISVLVVLVLFFKRRLYFQPEKLELPAQAEFQTASDQSGNTWTLYGQNGKTVVICGGGKGNKTFYQDRAIDIHNLGYSTVLFDYTGLGITPWGGVSEWQCYDDASRVVAKLRQPIPKNNLIVWGIGVGAAVASFVALRYEIPVVILESPYPGGRMYIRQTFPLLTLFSFLFLEFDTSKYVMKSANQKILVIHCDDSEYPVDATAEIRRFADRYMPVLDYRGIEWGEVKAFIESQ